MSPEALEEAESICDDVILRPNIGWDFAAWRDALAREEMHEWDAVVLTNSSVVGPLFPLLPIVEKMEATDADFWGMVMLRHRGTHLQSYFLSFGRNTINSQSWTDFWSKVEDKADKKEVIIKYEVGITKCLQDAGMKSRSLMENPVFPKSIRMVHTDYLRGGPRIPFNVNWVNRTVEMHHELIAQGMPYLKASLLWGKDRYRFRGIESIRSIPDVDYDWGSLN